MRIKKGHIYRWSLPKSQVVPFIEPDSEPWVETLHLALENARTTLADASADKTIKVYVISSSVPKWASVGKTQRFYVNNILRTGNKYELIA